VGALPRDRFLPPGGTAAAGVPPPAFADHDLGDVEALGLPGPARRRPGESKLIA